MSWTIHFLIKKASQLVKELGATDWCIMALLFIIIAVGVIAIIIVKLVKLNPNNKDIRDIPGLAPPAMGWKLVWSA
nr:putative plant snare 12 [Quercus suber]